MKTENISSVQALVSRAVIDDWVPAHAAFTVNALGRFVIANCADASVAVTTAELLEELALHIRLTASTKISNTTYFTQDQFTAYYDELCRSDCRGVIGAINALLPSGEIIVSNAYSLLDAAAKIEVTNIFLTRKDANYGL